MNETLETIPKYPVAVCFILFYFFFFAGLEVVVLACKRK